MRYSDILIHIDISLGGTSGCTPISMMFGVSLMSEFDIYGAEMNQVRN